MINLIGKKVAVLDKGYVCCTGFLGNDSTIVESARVSLLGESKGEEKDKKLLRFLWDNKHTSPFEMVELALQVKAPIFVIRQIHRHRMAEYNEESGRYRVLDEDYHIPDLYRIQDSKNKQSSIGSHERSEYWRNVVKLHTEQGFDIYNDMIKDGIGREQAREHLGLNTYSTFRWKMNLHSWMHFLSKRCAADAQFEVRQYANCIYTDFVKELVPWTCAFFNPTI